MIPLRNVTRDDIGTEMLVHSEDIRSAKEQQSGDTNPTGFAIATIAEPVRPEDGEFVALVPIWCDCQDEYYTMAFTDVRKGAVLLEENTLRSIN